METLLIGVHPCHPPVLYVKVYLMAFYTINTQDSRVRGHRVVFPLKRLDRTCLGLIMIFLILLLSFSKLCNALPLATSSRWILDESTGTRVKLRCVNWVGHLEPLIVEGLQKQPLSYIADQVASMGFNCVRLTWATYMFTRANYTALSVAESLDRLDLKEAKAGIAANNPEFLNITLVEVQKAVIDKLGAKNIMVVLDNHVSKPQWCCGEKDGNGFFGDFSFDPEEWIQGLITVAKQYKDNPTVVAMSTRNELRGPLQNKNDWYRYIQEGAAAIHGENPALLVIISGLSYETDLSFLKERPLEVNLTNKIVYEAHWYSFSSPSEKWSTQTNELCANVTQSFLYKSGFLISSNSPVPLFLSEFGVDQGGANEADNRYLSCSMATMAELDLDWALWTLQGSYILRQGIVDMEEVYGVLDAQWYRSRNPTIQQRLQLVKQIIQDSRSDYPANYIMYHPQSGQCVQVANDNQVYVSDCQNLTRWNHRETGSYIQLKGTFGCLRAVASGSPAIVSSDCSSSASFWTLISSSKLHIALQDEEGRYLCLERNSSDSQIVTNKCLCLDESAKDLPNCAENPQRQWFKLVPTNR